MSDFQTRDGSRGPGFVTQISDSPVGGPRDDREVARQAAALRGAIGELGSVVAAAARSARATTSSSCRRSSSSFVTKHPGLRIEQINKQLGTSTKDLALPIRKLIADGVIKTKGKKRSTTYFAGSKKSA